MVKVSYSTLLATSIIQELCLIHEHVFAFAKTSVLAGGLYITTLNRHKLYTPYLNIVILCTTQFDTLHLSNIGAPTNHNLTFFSAGIEMRCSVLAFAVCYVVNVYSVGK